MTIADYDNLYAATREEWRKWLTENHAKQRGVWLIQYKKNTGKPTLTWSDAVDEALCFGWIDSIKKKLNEACTVQFFSKRKPTSMWSKINKEKVNRLIENGLMTQAGFESIEIAKQHGSWTRLDEVEELKIPPDLDAAFERYNGSKHYFESLSKSTRKALLQWLVLARRPETRQKRINEIAALASQSKKPKPFS
ncbi:YdeI/OmpD-associated family protein [Parapedobacter sp. DT-150]|uniref:YdeI/OmpD-associated family protein n=1 Tax=Parapedobacter sp. DT-150 TaxID=3396162 RepID=UPI003F19A528